jgi:hypothetical protein
MEDPRVTLDVNVNVEITAEALETIVQTVKEKAGRNEKGHYAVDTHAAVGEMITRFLFQKDFDSFVQDPGNYPA